MPIPERSRLYLAIDQGGHAGRALVFDRAGRIIARSEQQISMQQPHPGWFEHDAETLSASLQTAICEAVAQLGPQKHGLCAAGLATQRSNIVCWHRKTGAACSKVISWQDRRAATFMQPFEAEAARLHEITGLFPSAHYGASKLRWCLDHLPAAQKALEDGTLCCGPFSSFLSARLTRTAQARVDPAHAARTLLWNIHTKDWDARLLEKFGIPLQVLPKCVASRHAFGSITVSGLEIPLCIVTGDQSAALFQAGPPQKTTTYINMGTGAFIQRILEYPLPDAPRLLHSVVFSEDHRYQYALEGTVNGAGAALSWFSKQAHCPAWPKTAETWLRETKAPPLFINGIGGLGAPFWQPEIDSYFIGEGDRAAQFCAVVESILFMIQANLDEMHKGLKPPKTLCLSGGLSVSDPLCQKLADLSETPVRRAIQHEATARGLFYLMNPSSRNDAEAASPQRFPPRNAPELRQRYQRWLKKMNTLTEALQ